MTTEQTISKDDLREEVRSRYSKAAQSVLNDKSQACCGGNCGADPITSDIYEAGATEGLPENAVKASLGCGNPTALVELEAGQTVLDLGSGGGIDVLLSAKRVGQTGFAYGLDMTDEMLELAEKNKAESGLTNVKFLKGIIEEIPLPDDSVDVVLSNCVVNLSTEKERVFAEAFRVLRPNGRWAVADVITLHPLPENVQKDIAAYTSCIAGALEKTDYESKLKAAGFQDIEVQILRTYNLDDFGGGCCSDLTADEESKANLASAFIRARKP
nr:adenosylmethyltransferase [uncultured bacterium]